MKSLNFNLSFFLFLIFFFPFFFSKTLIQKILDTKDLVKFSECLEQTTIKKNYTYQINNSLDDIYIIIQYKKVNSLTVYNSSISNENIVYQNQKDPVNSENGLYYLDLQRGKNYFINIYSYSPSKVCMKVIKEKYLPIYKDSKHNKVSFDLISSGEVYFSLNNSEYFNNNLIALRFNKKKLRFYENPSIKAEAIIIDDLNVTRNMTIDFYNNTIYTENKYCYLIFFIEKQFKEKIVEVKFDLFLTFVDEMAFNNLMNFEIETVDTYEIAQSFIYRVNEKNRKPIKNIFFINLNRFMKDRIDIFLFMNDLKHECIKPNLADYYNITNDNVKLIENNFIDINKNSLRLENYTIPYGRTKLLFFIIDESLINEQLKKENIFINFEIFGNMKDLIRYQENADLYSTLFNRKGNILIKKNICRNQVFLIYSKKANIFDNNAVILDKESIYGKMKFFYSNNNTLGAESYDDYLLKLKDPNINNEVDNSIMRGDFNFLLLECEKTDPLYSFIYGYKMNEQADVIKFMNQRTLVYIENNKKYQFRFESDEEFYFRIRIYKRSSLDYILRINYEIENIELNENNKICNMRHPKGNQSPLIIEVFSRNIDFNGVILEFVKGTQVDKENIVIQFSEVGNGLLEENKGYIFSYDQNKIDSFGVKLVLKNEKGETSKVWINKGYGEYPFYIMKFCNTSLIASFVFQNPDFFEIKRGRQLELYFENPYLSNETNNKEKIPIYTSVSASSSLKFSYLYDKLSNVEENKYFSVNNMTTELVKINNNLATLNGKSSQNTNQNNLNNDQSIQGTNTLNVTTGASNSFQTIPNNNQTYSNIPSIPSNTNNPPLVPSNVPESLNYVGTYSIYYQINPCSLDSRIQANSYDICDGKGPQILKEDLYKETLDPKFDKIILTSGMGSSFKFKYTIGESGNLQYKNYYKRLLSVEQKSFQISLNMDPPFSGDLELKILIMRALPKSQNTVKNFCEVVDLYESNDKNKIIFIQKSIKANSFNLTSTLSVDIPSQEISTYNFHEVDIYVITNSKKTNLEALSYANNIYLGMNVNGSFYDGYGRNISEGISENEDEDSSLFRRRNLAIMLVGCIIVIGVLIFALIKAKKDENEIYKYHRLAKAAMEGNINDEKEKEFPATQVISIE